ncbi:MAG: hypothetical protein J0L91_00420 [Burkholderiales bacterium]|nr:hypothetical protein [Burkholderiales bacterium]
MNAPPSPLAVAQVVARNLVPIVGILAFGWSASTILLLYFADTLLSLGVMFAGLASWFGRGTVEDRWAARLNAEVGYVASAAFIVAFIAVPLGVPLVFVGAMAGWNDLGALFSDPALQAGLAWQVVAAVWSYSALWRELHVRSPDELRLKRRFSLVFLRWIAVLMVVYSPILGLFGRFGPLVLVIVYAGVSVVAEVAPDRILALFPDRGGDALDPPVQSGKDTAAGNGGPNARRNRRRR